MSSPEEDDDSEEGLLSDLQLDEIIDHDEDLNLFENLIKDFQDMMSDKEVLRSCIKSFVDNMIEELTLGVIFDMQRKYRTNAYCLEVESDDEEDPNDGDVFQQQNIKKILEIRSVCPNCDGVAAALRFASHLDKCMGISRLRASSRRVTNNQEKHDNSNMWDGIPSDDDNDADWSSTKKKRNRKKKKDVKKKTRGEEDDLTKLSDMLHLQDRRSHNSSPSAGASTSGSPKKHDKLKKRNRGKDSPSSSMMMSKY